MGRAPCCEKVGLNRGPWTREEDMRLIHYIQSHGGGCWRTLPKAAGLLRCGKSCRLRWINYLRPDLKRGNISEEEDRLIIKLHSMLGNRWSLIAGRLPGRTDNEIKNYWNTHLKKKLRNMGIDPKTHAPLAGAADHARRQKGSATKKRSPLINTTTPTNQLLITSRNQLATSLITPTNPHPHPQMSFKSRPLDHATLLMNPILPFIPSSSSPSFTSLLAPSLTFTPPHFTHQSHPKPCPSLPPFSLPLSSLPMEYHPQFLPTLAHSHSKNNDTHIPHCATLSAKSATPYDHSSTSCFPWAPSSFTSLGTTPSTSPSFSLSSSSSSSSPCAHPSITDTYHKKDNTCNEKLEEAKYAELEIKERGNLENFVEGSPQGGDLNVDEKSSSTILMKDCDLSLMEGELMWDMEMIHSFQEVGTPTTSSMPTLSSTGNLWSHDLSSCYTSSPLQTWLNVGPYDRLS